MWFLELPRALLSSVCLGNASQGRRCHCTLWILIRSIRFFEEEQQAEEAGALGGGVLGPLPH